MTVSLGDLDAHEQPSEQLRAEWKAFTRFTPSEVLTDPRIDDPRHPEGPSAAGFVSAGSISTAQLTSAFSHIGIDEAPRGNVPILYHPMLPGLLIMPDLIPPSVQTRLVDLMVHRDLSNPTHQTNMHLHFNLPYPPPSESFFTLPPDSDSIAFTPKDPTVHKPQSVRRVLDKKLHWVTLGGQYDWTNRVYPDGKPPVFPEDIGGFLEDLWPETRAEAAIVNFYSPGDSMMMHRDVSEETDRGLISLSMGCDGLFMIAPSKGPDGQLPEDLPKDKDEKGYLLLRLRSGDAIYMTEESRYAWHGVPKVVKGTCPGYMEDWPASNGDYEDWRGWMKNKRINLNVRQMRG
jgi:DNA alkylation damage repair protein AlkB